MKTKKCKTCGQDKPISEYYTKNTGWVFTQCKRCYLDSDKRYGSQADPKVRDAYRRKDRKRKAKWRKMNPEFDRAQQSNRRARRQGSSGVLTADDVAAVWTQWKGLCWVCGASADELDHFRPMNNGAGGTNTPDNIRPICASCNHKRDHGRHGVDAAMREAEMLREIQQMLRSCKPSSGTSCSTGDQA